MAELNCPKCSTQIELGQPFCAKCGLPLKSKSSGWFVKTLKGIGIVLVVLIAVPVLIGIGSSYSQYKQRAPAVAGQDTSAAPSVEVTVRPIEVQATQLAAAYDRNGVGADGQFKGRSLRVTGYVTAIGTDVFNHAVVTLDGKVNPFLQPQAILSESERSRAGTLNVGQKVVLVCTGAGDVIKAPMLNDCAFSN